MRSLTALLAVLAVLAVVHADAGLAAATGALRPDGIGDLLSVLRSRLISHGQAPSEFVDEEHSKLELKLRDALLLFRDKLTEPLPELGLPTLDPFVYTGGDTYEIVNEFASLRVALLRALSEGGSKFRVNRLSLYLVEREGVLELTLPGFALGVVADIPEDSWVSPLKIHLDDRLNVSFSSPQIKLGVRGKLSVKNARLSMESTKIDLDLGKWQLGITCERPGLCTRNPGVYDLLAALARDLMPRLLHDWMPVLEKFVTKKLDEKLQKFQISDLVPDVN